MAPGPRAEGWSAGPGPSGGCTRVWMAPGAPGRAVVQVLALQEGVQGCGWHLGPRQRAGVQVLALQEGVQCHGWHLGPGQRAVVQVLALSSMSWAILDELSVLSELRFLPV